MTSRDIERARDAITRHLRFDATWTPHAVLRRKLKATLRPRFNDAVAELVAAGVVESTDGARGVLYRRVAGTPLLAAGEGVPAYWPDRRAAERRRWGQ